MVKQTQTICRQQPTNCLNVFDHFVELVLKGLEAIQHNPCLPITAILAVTSKDKKGKEEKRSFSEAQFSFLDDSFLWESFSWLIFRRQFSGEHLSGHSRPGEIFLFSEKTTPIHILLSLFEFFEGTCFRGWVFLKYFKFHFYFFL